MKWTLSGPHWPGQEPVRYLHRYPDRFPLMRLKDLRKGV
jgi:hypothetical protein